MLIHNLGYKIIFDQGLLNHTILPLKQGPVKVHEEPRRTLNRATPEILKYLENHNNIYSIRISSV